MSKPTSAATPAKPTSSPATRLAPRVSSPVAVTSTAPTSGTAATSRPVSELDSFCSACPSSTQGMQISTNV